MKEFAVPISPEANDYARWRGLDKNNNPLPQGIYIYVIESNGEIVCEGTVIIAR